MSWSTSCSPTPVAGPRPSAEPIAQSSERSFGRPSSSARSAEEDDDALPQRTSKPPIKTYEARQRIGLKLKIKQEAGFSKVVHNTALDPVHSQTPHTPQQQTPEPPSKTRPPVTQTTSVIRTPPPTCNPTSSTTFSAVTTQAGSTSSGASSAAPASSVSHSWSSSSSSSSTSSAQMNGTLEHHEPGAAKQNPTPVTTPQLTTCRLPLRKTYRENISPRHRPGVPGGGDIVPMPTATPPGLLTSSPQPEKTVIASVKLEQQGGSGTVQSHTHPGTQGLMAGEDELFRGIKNHHHHRHHHRHHQPQQFSDKEDEEDGDSRERLGRVKGLVSKNRERALGMFQMDQHAPGPPSPGETSCTRDSSLPAKRCKSDSPDMDNASFSSGSPPPDDSLNEHLQCAIDSILNLQQGPPGRGPMGRVHATNLTNQHQTHHRQSTLSSSSTTYRHSVSSSSSPSSSSVSQHPQVGGRGQNGSLVSQMHSR